jgi:hypothetical protein
MQVTAASEAVDDRALQRRLARQPVDIRARNAWTAGSSRSTSSAK